MAYNRKNYLLRVKEVNEVFKEHWNKGYPMTWIYREYIKDRFYMSLDTFYRYLGINYKKELEEMQENEMKCNQPPTDKTESKKAKI